MSHNLAEESRFRDLRRMAGFTIVELLVVITVVSLLLSLLMPVFSKTKEVGRRLTCASNQRQMFLAYSGYGGDYQQYPTNYGPEMGNPGNWGDESASFMTGGPPTSFGTPAQYPNTSVDVAAWPSWADAVIHRVLAKGYLPYYTPKPGEFPPAYGTGVQPYPSKVFYCTGQLPANLSWGGYGNGVYSYNGPHTNGGNVANNGALDGLYIEGQHDDGETWGLQYKERVGSMKHRPDSIAFMGCPSIFDSNNKLVYEPHGYQSAVSYAAYGYGNGQTDSVPGWGPDIFHFDRNFVFGDGHVKYLSTGTRYGIHGP